MLGIVFSRVSGIAGTLGEVKDLDTYLTEVIENIRQDREVTKKRTSYLMLCNICLRPSTVTKKWDKLRQNTLKLAEVQRAAREGQCDYS